MKPIIPPIDKAILKQELSSDKFLRPTNKAHNEIYVITAHNAPNVMLEIGRLRELSFRSGGGGTGEEIDTDEYDYMEKPYFQLVVWDPVALEIIGGYRYLPGHDVDFDEAGQPKFVMSHLFIFTEKFIKEYHFIPHWPDDRKEDDEYRENIWEFDVCLLFKNNRIVNLLKMFIT